ncbi:MAG TPA: helix-turn-helix domain-containing protein [Streptosporangiaceae bacterium]|nr:helix-turn-helix domain-containing protein [Streptosporangiaceae bacterium]
MAEPSALPGAQDREPASMPLLRTMLGDVLRRTRLDQGRTLADVARHARVSMPYLSEVERGRKEASSEVLAAICDALRIGLADLLAMIGSDLADQHARHDPLAGPLELPGRLGQDLPAGPAGLPGMRDAQALLGLGGWHSAGDAGCRLAA